MKFNFIFILLAVISLDLVSAGFNVNIETDVNFDDNISGWVNVSNFGNKNMDLTLNFNGEEFFGIANGNGNYSIKDLFGDIMALRSQNWSVCNNSNFCVKGNINVSNWGLYDFNYNSKVVGKNFALSFLTSKECKCYFIDGEENGSISGENFEHSLNRPFDEGEHEIEIFCSDEKENISAEPISFIYIDSLFWDITSPDDRYIERNWFDLELKTNKNVICRYSENEDDDFIYMDAFDSTNGTKHELYVSDLVAGKMTYYIGCKDNLGEIFYRDFNFRIDLKKPTIYIEPHYVNHGKHSKYFINYTVKDDADVKYCILYSNIFGKFKRNDYSNNIENGEINYFALKNINFSKNSYIFEVKCWDYSNKIASSGNRTLRVLEERVENMEDVKKIGDEEQIIVGVEDNSQKKVDEISKNWITGFVVGNVSNFINSDYSPYFTLTLLGVLVFLLISKFSCGNKGCRINSITGKKNKKDFSREELIDLFAISLIRERKKMGLSIKAISKKIGVNEEDIRNMENGLIPKNNFELISKLEDFYGINLRRYKG